MHELTEAIGAVGHCLVLPPAIATKDDLMSFHDEEYVAKLQDSAENYTDDRGQVGGVRPQ